MTLYLLPNFLSKEGRSTDQMSSRIAAILPTLSGLIVESPKAAALFLPPYRSQLQGKELPWTVFREREVDFLLDPIAKGESWGFLSDAGLPCIADPGYSLVKRAKERRLPVEVLVGFSSVFLALMLSGLPTQRFFFHGYLEKGGEKGLLHLEKGVVHIYIEAPFRNHTLLEQILRHFPPHGKLSLAVNLTSPQEWVKTHSIHEWKEQKVDIQDIPTLFLLFMSP